MLIVGIFLMNRRRKKWEINERIDYTRNEWMNNIRKKNYLYEKDKKCLTQTFQNIN
jgi:hypothetical protein